MPDDHSEVEPLLPIPNRTVKRFSADDSEHLARESRSSSGKLSPNPQIQSLGVCFFPRLVYSCAPKPLPADSCPCAASTLPQDPTDSRRMLFNHSKEFHRLIALDRLSDDRDSMSDRTCTVPTVVHLSDRHGSSSDLAVRAMRTTANPHSLQLTHSDNLLSSSVVHL